MLFSWLSDMQWINLYFLPGPTNYNWQFLQLFYCYKHKAEMLKAISYRRAITVNVMHWNIENLKTCDIDYNTMKIQRTVITDIKHYLAISWLNYSCDQSNTHIINQ